MFELTWRDAGLFAELDALKIVHVFSPGTPGTGKVYLGLPGVGGGVDETGEPLANWVGEFLRAPSRQDVVQKLAKSRAACCHVFIPVSYQGAPWSVDSYLTGAMEQVPATPPDLPSPIATVWVVSRAGNQGICWDGSEWRTFEAVDAAVRKVRCKNGKK